jgi:signal transduction histidine kinase/ActR/RegA family two-component response regulator
MRNSNSSPKLPRFSPKSLRWRLVSLIGSFSFLLFSFILSAEIYGLPFGLYDGLKKRYETEAIQDLSQIADTSKDLLTFKLTSLVDGLDELIENEIFITSLTNLINQIADAGNLDSLEEVSHLEKIIPSFMGLSGVRFVTPGFDVDLLTRKVSRESSFPAENKEMNMSDDSVLIGHSEHGQTINFYYHLSFPEGLDTDLVAIFSFPLEALLDLSRLLLNSLGPSAEIVLIDSDGLLLLPLKYPLNDGTFAEPLNYKITARPAYYAAQGVEGVVFAADYRGVPVLSAVRNVRVTADFGMAMVVKQDRGEVFAPLATYIFNSVAILFSGLILLLILLYIAVRSQLIPFEMLSKTVREIQNGDLSARTPYTAKNEIGDLSRAFNEMAEKIEAWHQALDDNVKKRTDELLKANALLSEEIVQRKEAEEQRRELEIQVRQKHKMEAVGVLAGGMAHNFNNNLAIILGNLELVQLKSTNSPQIGEFLENAKTALMRSRQLVKQIMTYSRQERHDSDVIKLADVIDETVRLLNQTIPSSVTFSYDISPDAAEKQIKGDATRVQEALINLCNNSIHAMDEKGNLTINADICAVEIDDIPEQFFAKPGEHYRIQVIDTGCGIAEDLQEKIFDPFFTTKQMHEGTGMGLSTVRGIIDQHQGFIKVISLPGQGTTIELYFPLATEQASVVEKEQNHLHKGTESLLFVDDDEMLAKLGKDMLSELGYQVTSVTDANEAHALIQQDPARFDLVLTDQTMPGMTGAEFIRKLKQLRADLPVILCTGYTSQISEKDALKIGAAAFCMKPLEMTDLATSIRTCLSGTNSSVHKAG